MKKILFLAVLFLSVGVAKAGDIEPQVVYELAPGFKTATSVLKSSFTVADPGAGLQNCITGFTLMSSTISNMEILDGSLATGTTLWGLVNVPASTPINVDSDRKNALCSGADTTLVITVSSGTVSMNYRGYVKGAR